MFISNAYAQAATSPASWDSMIGQLLPVIIMFGLLYLMIIRPQLRRSKEAKSMLEGLQKGDEVVASGLLGKVTKVGENFVSVEIADNVIIAVQKQSVTQLLPKGTIKAAH